MFHTLAYKGHYIHLSYIDNVETIRTQIIASGGGFELQDRRTILGAKRAITRRVRDIATRADTI